MAGVRHGLYDHTARLLYGQVEGCKADCWTKKVKPDDLYLYLYHHWPLTIVSKSANQQESKSQRSPFNRRRRISHIGWRIDQHFADYDPSYFTLCWLWFILLYTQETEEENMKIIVQLMSTSFRGIWDKCCRNTTQDLDDLELSAISNSVLDHLWFPDVEIRFLTLILIFISCIYPCQSVDGSDFPFFLILLEGHQTYSVDLKTIGSMDYWDLVAQ